MPDITITVEANNPAPERRTGKYGRIEKAIQALTAGQNILISPGYLRGFAYLYTRMQRKYGIKVALRSTEGGVRIWRLS